MGTYAVGTAALNALSGIPVRTGKARSGALHRTGVPVLAAVSRPRRSRRRFSRCPPGANLTGCCARRGRPSTPENG